MVIVCVSTLNGLIHVIECVFNVLTFSTGFGSGGRAKEKKKVCLLSTHYIRR